MRPVDFSRPAPRAASVRRLAWGRLTRIARLGLGGIIIGSFIGAYVGAALGIGYAVWAGNLSAALDGALLGGAVLALLGGCYGLVLGVTEREASDAGPALRATPIRFSPAARPAGRPGASEAPAMEHAHGG